MRTGVLMMAIDWVRAAFSGKRNPAKLRQNFWRRRNFAGVSRIVAHRLPLNPAPDSVNQLFDGPKLDGTNGAIIGNGLPTFPRGNGDDAGGVIRQVGAVLLLELVEAAVVQRIAEARKGEQINLTGGLTAFGLVHIKFGLAGTMEGHAIKQVGTGTHRALQGNALVGQRGAECLHFFGGKISQVQRFVKVRHVGDGFRCEEDHRLRDILPCSPGTGAKKDQRQNQAHGTGPRGTRTNHSKMFLLHSRHSPTGTGFWQWRYQAAGQKRAPGRPDWRSPERPKSPINPNRYE